MRWSGSICALITPFDEGLSLDFPALSGLVEWHVASGTSALVIAGSTGEAALLEDAEYQQLLEAAVRAAAGRLPIIAGIGSPSTAKSSRFAAAAAAAGAQAVLAVTPYYVRPTQSGLLAHFRAVADASPLPVILYNVPGRTGCDLLPATVAQLTSHPNIAGIKEARAEPERMQELLALQSDTFDVLSGDDGTGLRAMLAGARGVISVAANVVPELFARLCALALAGEREEAARIDAGFAALNDALGVESNPIPAKFLVAGQGRCRNVLRLPLQPLSPALAPMVLDALAQATRAR
ncbi:MAG: 4-hydroxy-tetrahydrodipicolinate synthase [Ahniella sp.]|nr:4-hydroxy-tetrahydrodipicolinate synthase [Ahniella sp.]